MDGNFYNGAVEDKKDSRDYIFESGLGAGQVMTDQEWEEGYDIEKVLGYKIKPKNQYSSYSCVGQANAQYKAILDALETGVYTEQSAKAIYSQISIGFNQGAYLRDGAKLLVDWGSLFESRVKSYKENGTTDESWMISKDWLTNDLTKEAKELKGSDYKLITGLGIDYFARAIKDGHGCVIGVTGTNNGTWSSTYPKPPLEDTPQNKTWGHAIYAGKFKIVNGKKYIGVLNSWGNVGEEGWQWLGEEWFQNNNRWVFNPWVVIDQANNNNNMSTAKILKDKNSSAVGIWLPAISEDVLRSYGLNMGKEIPMKDGHVDWENAIEGEFEYKK